MKLYLNNPRWFPLNRLTKMSRSQNWVFTINNYTEETIERLCQIPIEKAWIVFGKETAPSTGTKHLQGYIALADRTKRRTVEKLLGGKAWLDVTHSIENAIGYSIKDMDFYWNQDPIELMRLRGVMEEAKKYGSEYYWLGEVFDNAIGRPEYEPCEAYYETCKWNWNCKKGE